MVHTASQLQRSIKPFYVISSQKFSSMSHLDLKLVCSTNQLCLSCRATQSFAKIWEVCLFQAKVNSCCCCSLIFTGQKWKKYWLSIFHEMSNYCFKRNFTVKQILFLYFGMSCGVLEILLLRDVYTKIFIIICFQEITPWMLKIIHVIWCEQFRWKIIWFILKLLQYYISQGNTFLVLTGREVNILMAISGEMYG